MQEAQAIWRKTLDYMGRNESSLTELIPASELPHGGVLEIADAYAVCYLGMEQTAELYNHFLAGLEIFSYNGPDYIAELCGIRRVLENRIDYSNGAISELQHVHREANSDAAYNWFDKRIGDAKRFHSG